MSEEEKLQDVEGLNNAPQDKQDNNEDTDGQDTEPNDKNQNSDEDANDDNAPETYDFSAVELPDGMQLDKDLTSEFEAAAKEMNLSQAKADKLISLGVKLNQKLAQNFTSQLEEAKNNLIESYKLKLNTDPEIGGAKLKQSLVDANEAYSAFVDDEAAKLLSDSGLNFHPAIVKTFMKIGKQIKNDSIHSSNHSAHTRTAADWYPNMRNSAE